MKFKNTYWLTIFIPRFSIVIDIIIIFCYEIKKQKDQTVRQR